jgi:hypothetical protein
MREKESEGKKEREIYINSVCVCVCVCVLERKRERERGRERIEQEYWEEKDKKLCRQDNVFCGMTKFSFFVFCHFLEVSSKKKDLNQWSLFFREIGYTYRRGATAFCKTTLSMMTLNSQCRYAQCCLW